MEKKIDVMALPEVQRAVAQAETRLASSGRVLLRPSGTEPVIRVMVEGRDSALVDEIANEIAHKVESAARVAIAEVAA
jgi:phosphoglucosamine mutase